MSHDCHEAHPGFSPQQVLKDDAAPPCSIPDCGKPARSMGWCGMHHTRWARHGDPLFVLGKGMPRTQTPSYRTKHSRVTDVRGNAPQHLCEGGCGGRAREWATIHGREGLDPHQDYVPLCNACHGDYDGQTLSRVKGSAHPKARLRETDVADIKEALRAGVSIAALARAFRVAQPTVDSIKSGRSWGHVS